MRVKWVLLSLFCAFLPWVSISARAADDDIYVCVVAILAHDRSNEIEPKLRCLAKEIQKRDATLTCFRLKTLNCKPVTVGVKETFALVEGEVACVTVLQGFDKDDKVRLNVKGPKLSEIAYTTTCGKFFPLTTGYLTKDKDTLIIGVMVRSPECKGKK